MPRLSVNWVRLGALAYCAAFWASVACVVL
jgi:hypothetical protein